MTPPDRSKPQRASRLRLTAWVALCSLIPLGCVALAGLDGDYEVGDTGASGSGTGGSTSGTGGSTSGTVGVTDGAKHRGLTGSRQSVVGKAC